MCELVRQCVAGQLAGWNGRHGICYAVPPADQEDRGQSGTELGMLSAPEALLRFQDQFGRRLHVRGPVPAWTDDAGCGAPPHITGRIGCDVCAMSLFLVAMCIALGLLGLAGLGQLEARLRPVRMLTPCLIHARLHQITTTSCT